MAVGSVLAGQDLPRDDEAAASGPCGRRLRADAERNRERLITAAREIFAKRGL